MTNQIIFKDYPGNIIGVFRSENQDFIGFVSLRNGVYDFLPHPHEVFFETDLKVIFRKLHELNAEPQQPRFKKGDIVRIRHTENSFGITRDVYDVLVGNEYIVGKINPAEDTQTYALVGSKFTFPEYMLELVKKA